MERAWVRFLIGFASTLAVGGSLLLAVAVPLGAYSQSPEGIEATPIALPAPEPLPLPPAPLEEAPEPPAEKTWMPPAKGQKPEIVVHLTIAFPGSSARQTEFPFVWTEFEFVPLHVPGSYMAFGDGVGPAGEGIGSGQSINVRCQLDGEIAISAWAHWDLAGARSGEGGGKIVIYPETMVEDEVEEMKFGDGLVVTWWLTK